VAITAAVPTASLVSKSHTFFTSAVGTTEHRMASSVMAQPEMADSFAGLPGTAEDVEKREEAGDHHE
jgi:hypothetical protein